ncbi:hypothetical protein [Embleya hyalina]|uniref:Uncharacterized protein n=1 Tax=Embleya hyalina TaxID=516124 RepID=A0A401YZ68_9ACTN|nr:hypothetical protein [Embleya hyalina]GCD99887.1 hypothetical protein EHYA_07609 [Embleya hyalina]
MPAYILTNADRAEWAKEALEFFTGLTGQDCPDWMIYTGSDDERDAAQVVVADFLCDLRHACDSLGLEFEECNNRGLQHYQYERADEEEDA